MVPKATKKVNVRVRGEGKEMKEGGEERRSMIREA